MIIEINKEALLSEIKHHRRQIAFLCDLARKRDYPLFGLEKLLKSHKEEINRIYLKLEEYFPIKRAVRKNPKTK